MGEGASPSRSWRIITRVIVFLLLGAIVNVAVAWGCAWLRVDLRGYVAHGFVQMERPGWYVTICEQPGAVRMFGFEPLPEQEIEWRSGNLAPSILPYQPPRWSRFSTQPSGEIERIVDDARGWPLLALRTRFIIIRTDAIDSAAWTSEWIGAIPLLPQPPANSLPVWDVRALPLIPLWPGFAINTIFYAAILWLLWIAPGKVRRFVRVRRHRCPACGYHIAPGTGSVCSECGSALPERPSEQPT